MQPHALNSPVAPLADDDVRPRVASQIAAVVAALAVSFAIHMQDGEYTPSAMVLVTVAILAGIAIFIPLRIQLFECRANDILLAALSAGVALQLFTLLITWPAGEDQHFRDSATHRGYLILISAAIALFFLGLTHARIVRSLWFPSILLVHLLAGFWMVRASPEPHIDVWVFQQEGPAALLRGQDPYDPDQANFPDIYHSTLPGHQEVYGPGMSVNGRLRFGFPYPPVALLLSTAGYGIAHDHRYAQAAAVTLAGLLIGYSRRGRVPMLAATLLLFTPRVFFILGRAWTEPFVVMLLSLTIFCACRFPRWMPLALGLFLASKQYLVLAVPFSYLLLESSFDWRSRESWKRWSVLLIQAAAVAALVSLPLALWNWPRFWFSTVTVQQKSPFRWDSLSYLVFLGFRNSRYTTWTWLLLVALIPAAVLLFRKAKPTSAGFAAAVGMIFLIFFAFNKQAFCNYYFFVLGAFCCAAAAMGDPNVEQRPATSHPRRGKRRTMT